MQISLALSRSLQSWPVRTRHSERRTLMAAVDGTSLLSLVADLQDRKQYQELNWAGTFGDYLDLVTRNPRVTRSAFQRIYDMIMSYGTEEFIDAKKRLIRYKFFADPSIDEADAIYGLEIPLMRLVSFFRSAAEGYGTERRVLLLHGPVGSSKSTIVRRLKKGLELYSRTEDRKSTRLNSSHANISYAVF